MNWIVNAALDLALKTGMVLFLLWVVYTAIRDFRRKRETPMARRLRNLNLL